MYSERAIHTTNGANSLLNAPTKNGHSSDNLAQESPKLGKANKSYKEKFTSWMYNTAKSLQSNFLAKVRIDLKKEVYFSEKKI